MAGHCFGAPLAGLLVCAVALAGLRVEIVCPPNPFIGYAGEQLGFWAKAFDASGADVTEQCRWKWYFSDGVQLRGNPVAHAFAKAGKYTVTAAQLKSDTNAAAIEGTISDPPKGVGTLATEQCQMYVKLSDGTEVPPGQQICDFS